jgi:ParB-like chromosome segregation protein Spo0J
MTRFDPNVKVMQVKKLKPNPKNPRIIRDDKFKKLVESLRSFPEMMEKRPMVCVTDVDGKLFPLGGNMRLRAIQELGMKEIPDSWVTLADDWTQEKRAEFTIKDNASFGEWNYDDLANEWDTEQLSDWGVDVPRFADDPDYSILDGEDTAQQLEDMANGVKKAIQIEFEAEHYEEAYGLVKYWREQGGYVGGMIMEFLKAEKAKG